MQITRKTKEDAVDISQDGRGLGLFLSTLQDYTFMEPGCKIAFTIPINKKNYLFYASVRNMKKPKQEPGGKMGVSMGVKIYTCDQAEGIPLLAAYASQLITRNIR
jgi:hypothetical protein